MCANILLVDDEPSVRRAEAWALASDGHICAEAFDAVEARECLRGQQFDLALIDLKLPGASGLEVVKHIHCEHPTTVSMIVTGDDDPEVAKVAMDLGAYGYVVKPFKANELLINVNNVLRRRELELENRSHRERLEHMVLERTASLRQALDQLTHAEQEIRESQEETVIRLTRAAEVRDDETGSHIQRMSRYCELLAKRMGFDPRRCEVIRLASMMHDIGKIGIPDRILLKVGPLTPHEHGIMKEHAAIGHHILVGSKAELLKTADIIAWTHHERFDGSGYPRGLLGESIPIEGRIAAIGDVFDALTSRRAYKPAYSIEKALRIIEQGRGKHFDPGLVDLFNSSLQQVAEIKERYDDWQANTSFGLSAQALSWVATATSNYTGAM